MKTENEVPEEVRCFICLSVVDKNKQKRILLNIACKDCDLGVAVVVCPEDLEWIKNNKEASTAIIQSRLEAKIQNDKDS